MKKPKFLSLCSKKMKVPATRSVPERSPIQVFAATNRVLYDVQFIHLYILSLRKHWRIRRPIAVIWYFIFGVATFNYILWIHTLIKRKENKTLRELSNFRTCIQFVCITNTIAINFMTFLYRFHFSITSNILNLVAFIEDSVTASRNSELNIRTNCFGRIKKRYQVYIITFK